MPRIQVYLVVRSFVENDAYLYRSWYGRIANKAYSGDMSASQADWEQHFTVACYDDDPEVSSRQVMPRCLHAGFPVDPSQAECSRRG